MKRQYIAAVACLMAGAIGFVGVYSSEQAQKREHQKELAKAEQEMKEQQISQVSSVIEPKTTESKKSLGNQQTVQVTEKAKAEAQAEIKPAVSSQQAKEKSDNNFHFAGKHSGLWPVEGDVILPYSMKATIYFPTLDQYQYNPAMILKADINDKVLFIAKGKVVDVTTNEETGCTVKQDLGDGYTAIYGQLKELTFQKGDTVEAGQVVGFISEPTKYYSVEGSNLYFAMEKDGKPVDPKKYLKNK